MACKRELPDVIELLDSSEDEPYQQPVKRARSSKPAASPFAAKPTQLRNPLQASQCNSQRTLSQPPPDTARLGTPSARGNPRQARQLQIASLLGSQAGPGPSSLAAQAAIRAPVRSNRQAQPLLPWVEKHKPCSLEDLLLSVQRRKVQELQDWMESQLPDRFQDQRCRLLIVTGPSGCCKSTAIRVLSQELGFEIVEWVPPAPTLWSEHHYQAGEGSGGGGERYLSKLDQFDLFVSRAKYPSLPLSRRATAAASSSGTAVPRADSGGSRGAAGASSRAGTLTSSQQPASTPVPSVPAVAACSKTCKLVLIDDVPHAADADARKRLSGALLDLVQTARCPVILVTTESSAAANPTAAGANAASGAFKGLHKDVLASLQAIHASVTTFNPVTAANVSKVLTRVAASEGIQLPLAAAASIATVSQGDLRNAIQTLQLLYQRHGDAESGSLAMLVKKGSKAPSKRATAAAAKAAAARPLQSAELAGIAQAQRDQGLVLFHVLGKVLYNKRDEVADQAGARGSDDEVEANGAEDVRGRRGPTAATRARSEATAGIKAQQLRTDGPSGWMSVVRKMSEAVALPTSCQRPPMRYDPEDLLLRSSLEPLGATSFLHENYTSFIAEDAIQDVCSCAAYLSDAGFMACYQSGGGSDYMGFSGLEETPGSSVLQASAGSVATRGLLFANQHPAPRRFLAMRGPAGALSARACESNKSALIVTGSRMAQQRGTAIAGGSSRLRASEVMPSLRTLANVPSYQWLHNVMPSSWSYIWDGVIKVVRKGEAEKDALALRVDDMSLDPAAGDAAVPADSIEESE